MNALKSGHVTQDVVSNDFYFRSIIPGDQKTWDETTLSYWYIAIAVLFARIIFADPLHVDVVVFYIDSFTHKF